MSFSLFRDPFFGPLFRQGLPAFNENSGVASGLPVFPVDLVETAKTYIVKADLPGYNKNDISVESHEGGILTIRAERNTAFAEQDEKSKDSVVVHIRERGSGRVERVLRLPIEGIEEEGAVSASFDNGVLTVVVKKPVEKKPKKRTIELGKTRL